MGATFSNYNVICMNSREVETFTNSLLTDSTENAMASFISKPEGNCDSDMMIARMLQMQFDKEHDEGVKRTEAKYNGTSKGMVISFDYVLI